jgi:hypothetical protein
MKGTSKKIPDYKSRPKTRETNKLRLNSKALFNPSLKKNNLIILDDDTMEETKEAKEQSPVIVSEDFEAKVKVEPTYEMSDPNTTSAQSLEKFVTEGMTMDSSSDVQRYEFRARKPNISIDLNKPAPEENYEKCKEQVNNQSKQKIKKLQATCKETGAREINTGTLEC